MKKLQCTECRQTYWMQFREDEEGLIQTGEWVGIECPKCENPWAAAAPMRRTTARRKKAVRRAGGRRKKAVVRMVKKARPPSRRRRKPMARKAPSTPASEVTA